MDEGRDKRRGIFVLWAAPPGGVAPPAGEGPRARPAGTHSMISKVAEAKQALTWGNTMGG
jgi:hypothetical protein